MNLCSLQNCSREAIIDNKCILHCTKNEYSVDFNKTGFLNSFYDTLSEYIRDQILEYPKGKFEKNLLLDFINGDASEGFAKQIYATIEKLVVTIRDVHFPQTNSIDYFDYTRIFQRLHGVHFIDCTFYTHGLFIENVEFFFDSCEFKKTWNISNHKLLTNNHNILYQQCIFNENVSGSSEYDKEYYEINEKLFSDCIFKSEISFSKIHFKSPIFKNTEFDVFEMASLKIFDSIVEERLVLNNYKIGEISFLNTVFKDKLEIKENSILKASIHDSNFNGLADFFSSTFEFFEARKCIFSNFTGFENCRFGTHNPPLKQCECIFKFVTFLDFINFRNTKFCSGLDISTINYSVPPNFLNSEIEISETNRESFRIVKDSFDKNGNYIEGNKFYVNEMKKLRNESIENKNTSNRLLLFIYQLTSNYGQSYIRPILFIVILSLIYRLIIFGFENNFLYKILPKANGIISVISNFMNGIANHIIPFTRILKEGMEFISLIFYISFSTFIWLFILAVKRNTKR